MRTVLGMATISSREQACLEALDDLVYPPDYVSRTLAHALRPASEILSYHGSILATPVTRYYLSGSSSRGSTRYPRTQACTLGARA
jgi:hypothetical protein